jgi:hypothetical protein
MPATRYRSVTILTSDSALADALSTALFILPYDQGLQLIQSVGNVDCYWIFADGTVNIRMDFPELFVPTAQQGIKGESLRTNKRGFCIYGTLLFYYNDKAAILPVDAVSSIISIFSAKRT